MIRHISRWELSSAGARAFTTLMMCLRGSACIYEGEELGLPEAEVAYEDLQDPYGIKFWPDFKGRDGCRTPMVWDQTLHHGGFSDSARTWLPVSPDHLSMAVAQSEEDPGALIHHYRRAIGFRHAHSALKTGEMTDMRVDDTCLSFVRKNDREELLCVFNLSDQPATLAAPEGKWHHVGSELNSASPMEDGKLHLGPWQPALMLRER